MKIWSGKRISGVFVKVQTEISYWGPKEARSGARRRCRAGSAQQAAPLLGPALVSSASSAPQIHPRGAPPVASNPGKPGQAVAAAAQ